MHMGILTILPFIGLLLTIGIMSLIVATTPHSKTAHFWENNNNKLLLALLWSVPILIYLIYLGDLSHLKHSLEDYFSFLTLLFALFVISGGIFIEGDLEGTPKINLIILLIGAILANILGTTGASVLLIRPLLRTNQERRHTTHIVVFFIFLVSNIGGCLLPLGDPPLFLGYLKGVPFFWTLTLILPWITTVFIVLTIFYIFDTIAYKKESWISLQKDKVQIKHIKIKGAINFIWILGVMLTVMLITPTFLSKIGVEHGFLKFLREYILFLFAGLSLLTTPLSSKERIKNNFTFAPILEVAYLFIGIFITMIPALELLKEKSTEFGITLPWQFFWATGSLSAVLDNAPTYLSFLSLAQGLAIAKPDLYSISHNLKHISTPDNLLYAISIGAVFMGAMTYIGNAPNFMVKAIAEEWKYKVPHFFEYIYKYSIPILIPTFILITLIFLS